MSNIYVKDIDKDEIRNGFLVTTDRKKIWNKEIELLMEIDRICRKYNIKYVVLYGTMIGTVRHKGFIPWDDDIDVGMTRPDYVRFLNVAKQEIKRPYFLKNIYTDNRNFNFSKLMDDTTSAIEFIDVHNIHQGIFVDIFPLDVLPDGTERAEVIDRMCRELWMCFMTPHQVADGLKNGAITNVARHTLERIIELPLRERMSVYEEFCLNHFDDSSAIGLQPPFWCGDVGKYSKDSFKEIRYMDFETIKVPVPSGYEAILDADYNDWRIPKNVPSTHELELMSVDIPYDEMLKAINRDLLDSVEFYWEA
ncbi:LicD family protein [Anaerovibrio lipolyticus]|uniref:LicD family protein n=1 Tax=Anaerovibrio lipolyticus TaxID=82374 RepID=UPI000691E116|nr:LicD family protein [Anaerovibrio lipolyticus]